MLIDSYWCRLVLIDGHKLATLWPHLENAPGTLHWWSSPTSSDVLSLLFVIVIAWIALYTVLRWIALFVQLLHCVTIAPHQDLLPFLHNSSILLAMFVEIYDNCTWFINHKFTFGVYLNFCSRTGFNVKCPKSWNLDYLVSRMQWWAPPRDLRFEGGHLGWRQEREDAGCRVTETCRLALTPLLPPYTLASHTVTALAIYTQETLWLILHKSQNRK